MLDCDAHSQHRSSHRRKKPAHRTPESIEEDVKRTSARERQRMQKAAAAQEVRGAGSAAPSIHQQRMCYSSAIPQPRATGTAWCSMNGSVMEWHTCSAGMVGLLSRPHPLVGHSYFFVTFFAFLTAQEAHTSKSSSSVDSCHTGLTARPVPRARVHARVAAKPHQATGKADALGSDINPDLHGNRHDHKHDHKPLYMKLLDQSVGYQL